MADMSAVLGEAGGCPEIKWGGKTWKIGHPVQAARKHLEDLILERVEEPILARKESHPAAFRQEWDDHRADKRRGRYATLTGDLWIEQAMDKEAGPILFVASLLRCHQPGATFEDALGLTMAEPERVESALLRVLPDFLSSLLDEPRFRAVPQAERERVREKLRAVLAGVASARSAPTPSSSPA